MTELSTHTFELDLTSVCVSSGTIQLPFRMQQYFTPGSVLAEVDGQVLELEFHAPRRLVGLRAHFAERGLRSNDRVRFELEVEGGKVVAVKATCVRRERPKTAEVQPREQGKASHVKPIGEPWESGGGVRVVKRVRIPGLSAGPGPAELVTDPVVDEGTGRAQGGQANGSWGAVHEQEVFHDGITTVRAVRRGGANASPARPDEQGAVVASSAYAPEARDEHSEGQVVRPIAATRTTSSPYATVEASYSASAAEAARERSVELSDLIAPPLEDLDEEAGARRGRRWLLPPRLRLGAVAGQRQPHTSGPSKGKQADEPTVSDDPYERLLGTQAVRSEAEPSRAQAPQPEVPQAPKVSEYWSLRQPQRQHDAAPQELVTAAVPVPPAIQAAPSGSRGADDANASPFRASYQGYDAQRPQDRAPERGQVDAGPVASTASAGSQALPEYRPLTSQPAPAPHEPRRPEPPQPVRQSALIDDEDFGGDYLQPAPQAPRAAATPGSLEDDIARVKEYLRSPSTPAIVRSEAVGHVLGMGEERAERALERISEEPESVSRIRRGAYMVRRRRD